MRFIYFLVIFFCPLWLFGVSPSDEPEFVIVIPSYNNGRNNSNICIKNLQSIFSQTYPKFSVIYVNDCSSDDTAALVENFVREYHLENRIKVINNTERKGAMRNLYEAIHTIDPHKIVVDVDGDDMLAHDKVLERIAKVYSNKNIWITFGSFQRDPSNVVCHVSPPSQKFLSSGNFANYVDMWQPLRTFYAKLFQLIKKEDLFYQDQFLPTSSDIAMMRWMLEMACPNHFKIVPEVLYLYRLSPISDSRTQVTVQRKCERYIFSKPPYKPLKTLFDNPELTN